VSAPPNIAPSEIMRRYFCVTSGEVTEEMIKNYIEHHFEPKIGENFGVET
jgi:putative transposase